MNIDLQKIISNISNYIGSTNNNNEPLNITINIDKSIFDELLENTPTEYDGNDTDNLALNLDDLAGMELKDGQLVNSDGSEVNDITKSINEFLDTDEAKELIDTDGNGEYSTDEIASFLDTIKDYDNVDSNISMEDLIQAMNEMLNNTSSFMNRMEQANASAQQAQAAANAIANGSTNVPNYTGGSHIQAGSKAAGSSGPTGAAASAPATNSNSFSTIAVNNSHSSEGCSDVADYASKFLGYNEADGSADIFLGGSSSSATPWCAAFVQYVMEGCDNVPSWYQGVENKWYCPSVYSSAKANNAVIDASQTKSGDIVLFDWDSDGTHDHIGIVKSINEDGTITTIEGNSSDKVQEKTYQLGDSRLTYCSMDGVSTRNGSSSTDKTNSSSSNMDLESKDEEVQEDEAA